MRSNVGFAFKTRQRIFWLSHASTVKTNEFQESSTWHRETICLVRTACRWLKLDGYFITMALVYRNSLQQTDLRLKRARKIVNFLSNIWPLLSTNEKKKWKSILHRHHGRRHRKHPTHRDSIEAKATKIKHKKLYYRIIYIKWILFVLNLNTFRWCGRRCCSVTLLFFVFFFCTRNSTSSKCFAVIFLFSSYFSRCLFTIVNLLNGKMAHRKNESNLNVWSEKNIVWIVCIGFWRTHIWVMWVCQEVAFEWIKIVRFRNGRATLCFKLSETFQFASHFRPNFWMADIVLHLQKFESFY